MTYLKFRRPWYVSLARIFRLVTVMSASHDVFYQEFVQPRSVKLCAWAKKTTYLIHINTGSLVKKYDRFVFLLEQFSFIFNVIMLTEIWFNSFNSVPTLPGYNCFFANRTNSRGGGIAIFISGDTGFFWGSATVLFCNWRLWGSACTAAWRALFCVVSAPFRQHWTI